MLNLSNMFFFGLNKVSIFLFALIFVFRILLFLMSGRCCYLAILISLLYHFLSSGLIRTIFFNLREIFSSILEQLSLRLTGPLFGSF